MANILIYLVAVTTMGLVVKAEDFPITDPPSAAWNQEMVNVHERLRQGVSPSAANMHNVVLNQTMADMAKTAADRCDFLHSYGEAGIAAYSSFGENIFKGGYIIPERVSMAWFKERNYYTYNDTYVSGNCQSGKVCGHYKQVVAYTVAQIGCGYKVCPDGWKYVYCLYNRGQRTPPYNSGKPCSACVDDSTKCVNGLCANNADTAPNGIYNGTCELQCRNCGARQTGAGVCGCDCPVGTTSGMVCMGGTPPSTCVSACSKLGRVCLNGGTETSNVAGAINCTCQCPDAYFGEFCQISKAEAMAGVVYKLAGKVYDSNIFPVSPFEYKTSLETSLNAEIAAKINTDCMGASLFRSCCPGASAAPTANVVEAANIKSISSYPFNELDGNLVVGLYATVTTANCPGTTYLPVPVLKDMIGGALNVSATLANRTYTFSGVEVVPTPTTTAAPTTTRITPIPTTASHAKINTPYSIWIMILFISTLSLIFRVMRFDNFN